jgi:hypothetical protein
MYADVIRRFLKAPYKLVKFYRRAKPVLNLLNITSKELIEYMFDFLVDFRFHLHIERKIRIAKRVSKNPKLGGWIDLPSGIIVYTVIRKFKPEIVIETGVGPGASSAFILKALEDNKKGKLYSIDLPGNDAVVYPKLGKDFNIHIPEGFEVGWLIPSWLKHRHELIIGDSTVELPKLLLKLGKVDVFLHDSLHTDEHVLFELNTVISYFKNDGIVLCDDVNEYWTLAFIYFCKDRGYPYTIFNNRLGVCLVNV